MDRNKIGIYFLVLIIGIVISFFLWKSEFSFQTTGLLLLLLIFIPTLINPNIGLAIVIISVIYSPEIIAGHTTARFVAIRTEDILLGIVIFTWLIKIAFTKDIVSSFKTNITGPFFLYISVCVLSTLFAALFNKIDFKQSFFSILKYFEYFLLFIMVKDNIKNMRQSKIFIGIFLFTALVAAVHSNVFIQQQLQSKVNFFRVAPPVEARGAGESATMGGYLVFMMAIAGGLLIYTRSIPFRVFLICLEVVMFRAFLYTLSRGSYIAFIPALISLVYFAKRGKPALIFTLSVAMIFIILFSPQMIKDRVLTSATVKTDINGTHIELEESPRDRIDSWKNVLFERFPRSPLFGFGVARAFIDGQIFLTLFEVGLVGLALFAWVFVRLFKMVRNIINFDLVKNDDFSMGLTAGFMSGFVAMIAHALSINTFIVIKIMEPFWFMAAIVLLLPKLLEGEESTVEVAQV